MQGFIASKLDDFAQGKISRRRLIDTLMAAGTAMAAAETAKAAPAQSDPALKVAAVNHISYTCPNFRQAADWYSRMFNLEQVGPSDRDVALPFGKRGDKPMGVTANDVPVSFLIIRTREANAPPAGQTQPRRQPRALVQHMGYTVADFDRDKAKVEFTALGAKNVRDGGLYSLHMLDAFGYDIQVSGLANNAITDGA